MRPSNCLLCLLLFGFANFASGEFNYTKCPAAWELQSEVVRNSFTLKKFEGTYYELALHDYTRYPICPKPVCMRSQKVVDYRLKQINDTADLECFGKIYHNHFRFNLTSTPGFFLGTWYLIPRVVFPDTIVDVYENSDGVYEWAIEFQCVEKLDHVWFVGINWYSRLNSVSQQYIDNMLTAARKRGLGVYMDTGEKATLVDQKNRSYVSSRHP